MQKLLALLKLVGKDRLDINVLERMLKSSFVATHLSWLELHPELVEIMGNLGT